ncbi:hypothetical protein [Methanobacterium oryzae]|uniref:hypothetical protein n=1 Tax=Methanobacterium oryzae TaxID=69540 RepID=UPI003D246206
MMRKIIGALICLLLIFSVIDASSAIYLGGTSYGYVEKFNYGNQSSNQKIVIITGVHPKEYGFHNAISRVVKNKSSIEHKRYIVYKVHVTKDASDYYKGRMNGQLLAQKFVVPDVIKIKPKLAFDIHENRYTTSGYTYPRFLYPISKDQYTLGIAKFITYRMTFLKIYSPPNPTSVRYVTQPIADQGIPTIVYETYMYDSAARKASDANLFVKTVDNMLL